MSEYLDYIARRIDDASVLVWDTETTGLSWQTDHIVGHVLTFGPDPLDSCYLPIRHGGGGSYDAVRATEMLRASVNQRHDLRVVGFHLPFDLHMLKNDGIVPPGPLEDAQINAFLVDERQSSFSLDACASFMGVQSKKTDLIYEHLAARFGGPVNKNQMANFWRLNGDDPVAVEYASGDGTTTWQLWEKQQPMLDEEGLRRIWEIECRCIRVLHRMTRRGVKIDEGRLHQITGMINKRIEQARNALPSGFDEGKPTHMRKLFTDAGITDWPLTAPSKTFPNGQPSFAEEWLQKSNLGKSVLAVKKLSHLQQAFITPMRERHLYKGRVHCTYNQTRNESFGTITGRLSSSNPNLQQVPKRNKQLGALFRSIFIPDEGKIWGSADYSQCEPRLLAHYGQVKVLLDGYLSEPYVDAHSSVATAAVIDRESGKRLNQALITGAGDKKAAAMLGLPMKDAMDIVDKYFRTMPEIKRLQRTAADRYLSRGFVFSLLGRRARLDDRRFAYKAVNKLLQCGNADIIKKAMADVDEYLYSEGDDVHLLNNVHDALDFQFPQDLKYQYEKALDLMQDFGPNKTVHVSVPMVVDADEGDSWAAATYGLDAVKQVFDDMGEKY